MAIVLLFARSYRALPNPCVGGLVCRVWFSCVASWNCQCSVIVSTATRNRRITSRSLGPGANFEESQKQLWVDLLANPSEWLDNRLYKRSPAYPDFRHRRTSEPLWLSDQYKPMWVDSRLATLQANLLRDLGTPQQLGSCRPDHEVISLSDEGQLDKALDILVCIDQQGTGLSVNVYSSLLRACAKRKALDQARRLRAHMAKHGLDCTRFLGEYIVSTLVKCGGLEDALQIFYRLAHRTVFSWTAVISGYTTAGQGQEALRMYQCMQEQGFQPNNYTFVSLLKACGTLCNLKEGRKIHADALRYGCQSDSFVSASLVDMYAKCGSIVDARRVFDGLSHRSVVSWNTMLAAYSQQGEPQKTLELYDMMCKEGVSPENRTFVSVLQACGMLAEREEDTVVFRKSQLLSIGKSLHADARRRGYDSDVFVGCTLVSMYGKCGSILDAQDVFDRLSHRDAVSWNVMLAACVQQGQARKALQLYDQLRQGNVSPDDRTFVSALQACGMLAEKEDFVHLHAQWTKSKCLEKGKAIHVDSRKRGYDSHVFVGNALITMYGKCGSILDAQHVFDGLSTRDVVSWSAMVSACAQQGLSERALELYGKMRDAGTSPNERTLVSALQACGLLAEKEKDVKGDRQSTKFKSLEKGKAIHADAKKKRCDSDAFVGNTLVSMYGKCGSIVDARDVFDRLLKRDVVSWNAMLAAYVEQGQGEKSLQLYKQMQDEGVSPDVRTFAISLQACGMLAEKDDVMAAQPSKLTALRRGKALHTDAEGKGYVSNVFVGSALVSMYGKCGSILDARDVFDRLFKRDIVSWNAMLTAYVDHGQSEKALQLFVHMQEQGFSPNEITLLCILQASSNTGSLDVCRQVHHAFLPAGNQLSPLLATTLIHAYGRCGSMVDAQTLFDSLREPNSVTWTALIAGYARQGSCASSLKCYEEMLLAGMKPDSVTFLAVLSACSHGGLVGKGVEYFESFSRDHGITPETEHYACILDLLGRAGYFTRVEHLLSIMPMQPDLSMWLSVLGACRNHGKVVMGKWAFDSVVRLQPKDSAAYVLMLNIYVDAGLWNDAKAVKELRQKAGAYKTPGQSWIEYEQEGHNFVVGDMEHPQQELLYGLLGKVRSELEENGYFSMFEHSVTDMAQGLTGSPYKCWPRNSHQRSPNRRE